MERAAASRSSTEQWRGRAGARLIVAGRVLGAHGLRGQVRVRPYTGEPGALLGVPRVTLLRHEGDAEGLDLEVSSAAPGRRGEVRMALAGVRRREDAEELAGRLLAVDARHLEPPGPGEYYGFELVGCRVEREDGRAVGTVTGIWPTGAPDLLVVVGEDGAEHLIPAARDILRIVDVGARRIVIDAIPGLIEGDAG